jgi:hypothetical protein
MLDAIVSQYGKTPAKIKRQESKKKMKKPNSKTELLSAKFLIGEKGPDF